MEGLAGQAVVEQEADLEVTIEEMYAGVPPSRPEAEIERVEEALQLLTRAQRPVIVAGGGVTASGARAELIDLAENALHSGSHILECQSDVPQRPSAGSWRPRFLLASLRQPDPL